MTIDEVMANYEAKQLTEEFFDQAWHCNIERYRLADNIIIFCDPCLVSETFLIEITYLLTRNMKSSQYKQVKIYQDLIAFILETFPEVDVYRQGNKLFLRQLLF